MAELKVRHLQTLDLFRLARIISKCTASARNSLLNAALDLQTGADASINGKEQSISASVQELGFALFEAAVDQEEQIKQLFAGLVNMKPADFDKSPFDTVLIILERVMEQDDLPGFLSRAMGLVNNASKSLT